MAYLYKKLEFIENKFTDTYFTINNILFTIENLDKTHFESNYLFLLKQLTQIDPLLIKKEDFNNFIDNLNSNHIVKVIIIKGTKKVVGTITILKENKLIHNCGKVAHIEDVIVDKLFRGYGLGKKLLDIGKDESKDCYKITLDCNDKNIVFYEKCGFELKGNQLVLYN